jgi:hypothetical protein
MRVSSSDSDTDHIIIRTLLRFYFQHKMGNKIAILKTVLNTQDFSSVGLSTQGMTHPQRWFRQRIYDIKIDCPPIHSMPFHTSITTTAMYTCSSHGKVHLLVIMPMCSVEYQQITKESINLWVTVWNQTRNYGQNLWSLLPQTLHSTWRG